MFWNSLVTANGNQSWEQTKWKIKKYIYQENQFVAPIESANPYDSNTTPVLLGDRLTAHTRHIQKEKSKNSSGGHWGWRVAEGTLASFSGGSGRMREEQGGVEARRKCRNLSRWIHCCLHVHTAVQILYINAVGLSVSVKSTASLTTSPAGIGAASRSLSFWHPVR